MNSEPRGLAALAAQVGHYRLIFRWPERTASFLLPSLFVAAVAVHALAFFLFQVAYPPSAAVVPPQAQVTMLTEATPEGKTLLRWVQSQDPAIAATLQNVTPAGLSEVSYTPSYATVHTFQMEVEPPVEPVSFLPAHSLLDRSDPKRAPTETLRVSVATSLAFSEGLQARDAETEKAPLTITTKSSVNLRSSVFLVGIGDRGDVRYCFLQASSDGPSSGDQEIDKQAEALLRQHSFTHSETPLEWGFATFTWGAEAYAPHPAQATPPPKPEAPET